MASKIKPIRFKVHQFQEKRGDGRSAQYFSIEIEEKGFFGWSHKGWVDKRSLSDSFYPSDEPYHFFNTTNFERAIKEVEEHYDWVRKRSVISRTETNYIYEKNS